MFKTDPDFSYSEFKESQKEYIIQPFDRLEIRIFTNNGYKLINIGNENTYNQTNTPIDYLVEFDGNVKVPVLGRVKLDSLTIREAELKLENLYKNYYNNPFVYINVINRRVIVFSEGSTKGTVIDLKNENYTLIEALAESGGISDLGKAYKIKLIRGDLTNPEVYLFNISRIKDMSKANFILQSNDIIYVETRPRYASRILSEISPYFSMITTGLVIYSLFSK
ncbi:MAG: hypothetical protein Kow0068_03760 [Marinilabiliales bacterium]